MLITNRIVRNSFLLPIHEDYHMLISYIHAKLTIEQCTVFAWTWRLRMRQNMLNMMCKLPFLHICDDVQTDLSLFVLESACWWSNHLLKFCYSLHTECEDTNPSAVSLTRPNMKQRMNIMEKSTVTWKGNLVLSNWVDNWL